MFIAASFITAPKWKQSKYLPTSEWINEIYFVNYSVNAIIHRMAVKGDEVLAHAPAWMNPENTKLCQRSQSQRLLIA